MQNKYQYTFVESLLFPSTRLNNSKLKEQLNNKTVLITGASFGIGEELAYKLSQTSALLILVGRTTHKLDEVREKVRQKNGRAVVFSADLRKQDELDQLILFLKTLPGGVDIFVNNAGKSIHRYITDSLDRYHDFTRTMAINYNAAVKLSLALIPLLEEK